MQQWAVKPLLFISLGGFEGSLEVDVPSVCAQPRAEAVLAQEFILHA